jgi:endonuclease YncB( thermonuclease family)
MSNSDKKTNKIRTISLTILFFTLIVFTLRAVISILRENAPLSLESQAHASASSGDCAHTAKSLRCVVFVRNYDGDTITVNIPGFHPLVGEGASVRLIGIDTPEKRTSDQCEKSLGTLAQKYVEDILRKAKKINLENVEKDKYFRYLADVQADGESLSKKMIEAGFAVPYDGGTKSKPNWCSMLNKAKSK